MKKGKFTLRPLGPFKSKHSLMSFGLTDNGKFRLMSLGLTNNGKFELGPLGGFGLTNKEIFSLGPLGPSGPLKRKGSNSGPWGPLGPDHFGESSKKKSSFPKAVLCVQNRILQKVFGMVYP